MKLNTLTGFRNLINLIFPRVCVACQDNVPLKGKIVCLTCKKDLYYTKHHSEVENEFEDHFTGRISLQRGMAMLYYRKDSAIQSIMHELKYRGKKEVGVQLGMEYAEILKDSDILQGIDGIIPVPLHWKKQRLRGYNQAEAFANGISLVSKIPVINDLLTKEEESDSQTRMTRAERVKNVESVFRVSHDYDVEHKHLLLVDDVLTTGATLEACANKLMSPTTKISMATIAIGRL